MPRRPSLARKALIFLKGRALSAVRSPVRISRRCAQCRGAVGGRVPFDLDTPIPSS
jgi:hypothetical protein